MARGKKFEVTDELLDKLRHLSEQGLTIGRLAESLNIAEHTLKRQKRLDERVNQAIELGWSRCELRTKHGYLLKWVPNAEDLRIIEELAAKGARDNRIRSVMNISQRIWDSVREKYPEIDRALVCGRAQLEERALALLEKKVFEEEDTTALFFMMKAVLGFNDRPHLGVKIENKTEIKQDNRAILIAPEMATEENYLKMLENYKKETGLLPAPGVVVEAEQVVERNTDPETEPERSA